MEIREVTYLAVVLRIISSVIIGGIIGLERGIKNRAAGLRTYMLVCVGACMVMLTNQYIYQSIGIGDPVRMGAQVVSGIGFLGAGTIIVTRRSQIKGLTTAAGLWTAAGLGLALGIGFYEAAVAGCLAVSIVMTLMQRMEEWVRRKTRFMEIYFELSANFSLGDFLRELRERGIEIKDVQREFETDTDDDVRAYIAALKTTKRRRRREIAEEIQSLPGVEYLEEL